MAQPFLLKAVVDGQVNRVTQRITDLGIDSLFLRVDGRTGPSARRKTQPLAKHLAALRQTVRDRPVALIGDAVDDIRATVANQVRPVPYAGAPMPLVKVDGCWFGCLERCASAC